MVSILSVTLLSSNVVYTVPCPTLADPKYSRVVLSGDTAKYTCRIGYELDGNSVLNCGHDGKWDNSLPTCQGPSGMKFTLITS